MTPRRVLVVDDDVLALRSVERLLRHDHTVRTAHSGADAVTLAGREVFDVAIVDWILGDESGIDVIVELKRAQPTLLAVLVSARTSLDVATDAVHAGATRVVAKPFCARTVLAALDSSRPRRTPRWVPSLRQVEREHVLRTVAECGGNVSSAAKLLGVSRTKIYRVLGT